MNAVKIYTVERYEIFDGNVKVGVARNYKEAQSKIEKLKSQHNANYKLVPVLKENA